MSDGIGGGSGPRYSVRGRVSAAFKPYVSLQVGGDEVEVSPAEARRFALETLSAAEAAVYDSTLALHLTRLGLSTAEIAAMLNELVKARGE